MLTKKKNKNFSLSTSGFFIIVVIFFSDIPERIKTPEIKVKSRLLGPPKEEIRAVAERKPTIFSPWTFIYAAVIPWTDESTAWASFLEFSKERKDDRIWRVKDSGTRDEEVYFMRGVYSAVSCQALSLSLYDVYCVNAHREQRKMYLYTIF